LNTHPLERVIINRCSRLKEIRAGFNLVHRLLVISIIACDAAWAVSVMDCGEFTFIAILLQ
jgi:hypothetical protein